MGKPIGALNTFSGLLPPWSLSNLDTNFSNLLTAFNDYSTYSNYLADTSPTVNVVVATTPAGTVFSYNAGNSVQIKINNTNTGSTTLNVNGGGAKTVVNYDGSAMSANQLVLGSVVNFVYDGTNFQVFGGGWLSPDLVRTSDEKTALVTPVNLAYDPGNILRYGAVGDGVTDNFTAFSNAIAVAKVSGIPVIIPAGNFLINTASGTLNCRFVTFIGVGTANGQTSPPTGIGSVISVKGTANSPFTIQAGTSFFGVNFYYPDQVDSATPIVYPATLLASVVNGPLNFVTIQNCVVFNAYRFFVFTDTGGNMGHCFFINNTIYGILTCFEIQYNNEVITFEGNEFTFGHYLVATESGLRGYTRSNGTVLKVIQTDGITFQGNVCFGYQNAISAPTATGSGNGGLFQLSTIGNNYFDQCLFPITVSGNGNISNVSIIGNNINAFSSTNHALIGNCIKITTSGAVASELVTVSGNSFGTCTGDQVLVTGGTPTRQFTFAGNSFTSWSAFSSSTVYGGLNITGAGTTIVVNGNSFLAQNAFQTGLLGSVSLGMITGNTFGNLVAALNATFANQVVSAGNLSYGTSGATANLYPGTFSGNIFDVANHWDKDGQQTTGFGTPTGASVINNFPGATATLAQTSATVAEILTILKAKGVIAA